MTAIDLFIILAAGPPRGGPFLVDNWIDRKAGLVVLPELFSIGYFFDTREQALAAVENIPVGYTTERLCDIAKRTNCHITGAIAEKYEDNLYLSAVVVGPAGHRPVRYSSPLFA